MPDPLIVDLTRATADGVVEGSLAYSDLDDLEVEVGRIIKVSDLGAGPYKAEVVEVDGDRIRVKAPAFELRRPVEAGSPELVNARDLEQWAETSEARYKFPKVIRLLLAGTPGVDRLSVRAGRGIDLPGYDGYVERTVDGPYVPSGASCWEMGTGRDPRRKAQQDYRKRTDNPGEVKPADTVFVFVTPRRWAGKDKWARSCSEKGPWRKVMALDADDLEGWLQSRYIDHVRVSEQLGRRPLEAESLNRWWARWSARTDPTFPPDLLVAGRGAEAEKLREALAGTPTITRVETPSRKEALAFAAAALSASEGGISTLPGAVVVTSAAAWERCASDPGRFVLIPPAEESNLAAAVKGGHHVLIPMGAGDYQAGERIVLPRIGRSEARKAFEAAGVRPDRADRYAAEARLSLVSLSRRLSLHAGAARPIWAQDTEAELPAVLVLVGSWSETDHDREIAARITDRDIEEIERILLRWENTEDPPFRRSGGNWRLVNPKDAWLLLRNMVTLGDLKRWREAAIDVLGSLDSEIDFWSPIDPGQRIEVSLPDFRRPKWSPVLRRGLAQGAALLGASDRLQTVGGQTDAEHACRLVSDLLERAGADSTGKLWQSLSDVLPLLAEAAPDAFLDAVRRDSAGEQPLLGRMFADRDEEALLWGGSSTHTGLLWALETLCWSEDYFVVALEALMRLAKIDPGGRVGNRPLDSARRVLLPWMPQTSASLERRMEVLNGILSRHEAKGWELLLSLVPTRHSFALGNSRPRFRDWAPELKSMSDEERWTAVEEITTWALEKAGSNPYMWAQLIELMPSLVIQQNDQVLDALDNLEVKEFDDAGRFIIWKSWNDLLIKHPDRAYIEIWLSVERLGRLEEIMDQMRPDILEVSLQEHRELFTWHSEDLEDKQQKAIKDTYGLGGLRALVYLAKEVDRPELVGRTSADILEESVLDDLLPLLSDEEPVRTFVMAWIGRTAESAGSEWIENTVETISDYLDSSQASFFLALELEDAVWKILENRPTPVRKLYWQQIRRPSVSDHDFLTFVDKLIEYGRPWFAGEVLFQKLADNKAHMVSNDLIERILSSILEGCDSSEITSDRVAFYIRELLNHLDRNKPDSKVLLAFELTFFTFHELYQFSTAAIYRKLSSEPEAFVDLVCSVDRLPDEKEPNLVFGVAVPKEVGYSVLSEWRSPPGVNSSTGDVGHEILRRWVSQARQLLQERGKAETGDRFIGELLSGSPEGADEVWPAEPVRDLLEELDSRFLEEGLVSGRSMGRGVTVHDPFEGGVQERALAEQYRCWARRVEARWPSTGRILRSLASLYDREALARDERSEALADQD